LHVELTNRNIYNGTGKKGVDMLYSDCGVMVFMDGAIDFLRDNTNVNDVRLRRMRSCRD